MVTVSKMIYDRPYLSSFGRSFHSSDEPMVIFSREKLNKIFTAIWYHDHEISDEIRTSMNQQLEKTFQNKHTFTYLGDLFQYIEKEDRVTPLCLIISSDGVEYLMEQIKSGQKCRFIYGFEHRPKNLNNKERIYIDIDKLFNQILSDIQSYKTDQPPASDDVDKHLVDHGSSQKDFERPSPPFTIYESKIKQNLIQHLSCDSWKFLFFQTMSDLIVEMSHEQAALDEMIRECRDVFDENPTVWSQIDGFKASYAPSQAIYHYTNSSFIFRILSRAFRSENIERVYRCRKYVTDLHCNLVENFRLQQNSQKPKILYRGQKLPVATIQQLIDYRGCLISMNGFLSATHNINVAIAFSGECGTHDGYASVVYEMHIDENMIRPCANIGDISQFEYEEEVLFSLGSVWKIESVQCLSTFWEVVLYSCSKTDSQLAEVKHCLIHGPTLLSLGDILRKQGDLAKAERFYNRMLKDGSLSEKMKGFLYHGLGLTYLERDQVGDAVKYLEMALPLIENQSDENIGILPPFYLYTPDDRPSRVKILNNIGLMYQNIGEYDKARQWYFKGLEKPDETKSQLDRAAIYYNLGRLTYNQGLYREAYNYYQEAVRLANGYPINDKFQKVLSILETYLTEQCRQNCANDDSATDTGICAAYSHIVPTS